MMAGKEARRSNMREKRLDAEHRGNNEFVKRHQEELKGMSGRDPRMDGKMMDFCSYMSNDGEHAQQFGRELTAGLDKKAFPVK